MKRLRLRPSDQWWTNARARQPPSPISLALFEGWKSVMAFDHVAEKFLQWAKSIPGYQEGMFRAEDVEDVKDERKP